MNDEHIYNAEENSDWQVDDKQNIIEAVKNGDQKVFKRLFETYYNPMVRFAYRYVNSEAIAEGIVQNIFLWVWENRETWNVEGKLKTYLFRAVKYKALDHERHERIKEEYSKSLYLNKEPVNYSEIPFEVEEESEFVKRARQAIEELPERPRMVYKLSRLEGLTYNEIAVVLEISFKTVETHMSRALHILRKRLIKHLPALILFGSII